MKLVILGQGGYAMTVKDIAEQLGYEIIAMLDDKDKQNPLASFTRFTCDNIYFIPAFGNNEFRLEWVEKLQAAGFRLATLIHPSAYVSPKARINEGCVVLPKAVINTGVEIRKACIINLGAIVDHGSIVEEGCHICIGAIVKGENCVPRLTKIEAGEVIQARYWPV